MKLTIVSGRSGSGKSVILHTLEDLEYYCVDNIPPKLMPALLEELQEKNLSIAISIDARNLSQKHDLANIIEQLKADHECTILYIDASNESLLKRFKETRRRHPLTSHETSLREALNEEHNLLEPLVESADIKIDTTELSAPQLRQLTIDYLHKIDDTTLSILFESFGFKHGVPPEADFVFDTRCLPNPHWDKSLRNKAGDSKEVKQFLEQQPLCMDMLSDIQCFLIKWLPAYQAEQRKYLTIAIGCTGGHHRSVYFAMSLAHYFQQSYSQVTIRHRDLVR